MDRPITDNRGVFTPELQPGFFTEASARGAPTRWKRGDKVRFKNGIAEKMGGWVDAQVSGDVHYGVPRRVHQWTSLDGEAWIAEGTNSKLYVINRNVRYDITPVRRNVNLVDPFTTTADSVTVVVRDVAHSAQTGDAVRYSGATSVGGITIDGEYFISKVLDGDRYEIIATTAITTTTGGGAVVAQYDLNAGTANETVALGWGVCKWGESTWGTARSPSCSGIKRKLRVWSLDNFGEDLIASPRGGAVYWWDRTNGPLSRAVLLENAPPTNQHVLISDSGDQIICLGAFDPVANSQDPMFIRVGDLGSLTVFTIVEVDGVPQNSVFESRLSTGSEIITGVRTNNGILILTDAAVYLMQPNPSEIFAVRKLAEGNSAISVNALIEVDGTAYLMAPNKFMLFDGVYTEIPCDVWEQVFKDIDRVQKDKIYCWYNETFSEIWWFFPSATAPSLGTENGFVITTELGEVIQIDKIAENNRYVIYNKESKTWVFGTIERTAAGPKGEAYDLPFALDSLGNVFIHESGVDDNGNALEAFIESHDLQIGDGKAAAQISQAVPDMLRQTGNLLLTLKGKKRPNDAAYKTKGPYTITVETEVKGVRIKARQIAINYSSVAVGDDWRLGNWTFYLQPDSEG